MHAETHRAANRISYGELTLTQSPLSEQQRPLRKLMAFSDFAQTFDMW